MSGPEKSTRTPRIHLRHYLCLLILATLLPCLVLVSVIVIRTSHSDRLAAEKGLVDSAQVVASIVSGSFDSNAAILRTIGGKAWAEGSDGDAVVDLGVVEQHFAGEARFLPSMPEAAARSWTISNLVVDGDDTPQVTFSVPLGEEGEPILTLAASARALIQSISFDNMTASGLLVAVADGEGRIVARSDREGEFLGQLVPSWDALVELGTRQGAFIGETLDGAAFNFGFQTIPGTPGWVVVAGMPKAAFDARWQGPLATLYLGAGIMLTVSLPLAGWLAMRITAPINKMMARSRTAAKGDGRDLGTAPKTIVAEFAQLFEAQLQSQRHLADRADALALSNERLHAIARIGALATWRAGLDGAALSLDGWSELTGQNEADALGEGWFSCFHPEDQAGLKQALAAADVDDNVPMTVEARLLTPKGWLWVSLRGALIRDAAGRPVDWIGTLENIDERKRRQLRVSRLAYQDLLTGLANRARMAEHVEKLWAEPVPTRQSALLYVDLDRFKHANDTYGHAAGDAVLRQVAQRLNIAFTTDGVVARLGGDEFAVVIDAIEDERQPIALAERIVTELSATYMVNGNAIKIGASVGITTFTPGTISIEQAHFEADSALYLAKAQGRNDWAVYSKTRCALVV